MIGSEDQFYRIINLVFNVLIKHNEATKEEKVEFINGMIKGELYDSILGRLADRYNI